MQFITKIIHIPLYVYLVGGAPMHVQIYFIGIILACSEYTCLHIQNKDNYLLFSITYCIFRASTTKQMPPGKR